MVEDIDPYWDTLVAVTKLLFENGYTIPQMYYCAVTHDISLETCCNDNGAACRSILESSNGRTDDSESSNVGSNPALRTDSDTFNEPTKSISAGCHKSHYSLRDYERCEYCSRK